MVAAIMISGALFAGHMDGCGSSGLEEASGRMAEEENMTSML